MPGRRFLIGVVWVLAVLGLASSAQAQVLFGVGTDNRLYRVDLATGAATAVAPLDHQFGTIALDPSDGKLYGYVDPSATTGPDTIRVIDKTTGASQATPFVPNGSFSPSQGPPLMAITPSSVLYALVTPSAGSSTLKFGTIDKATWAWTPIGSTNAFPGFGFASAPDGTLYAAGADNTALMTVDRSTGATAAVTTLGGDGGSYVASLAIDQSGTIYAVLERGSPSGSTFSLVSIDRSTGALTPRGSVAPVHQIAFDRPDPAPAPGSGGGDGSGGSGQAGGGGSDQGADALPAPAPAAEQSPRPTTEELLAALRTQLAPVGRRARIRAILRARGFTYAFRPPAAGTLTLEWFAVPRGARLSAKPVLVATARRAFTRVAPERVRVRLTAQGSRRLKRPGRISLRARAVFTTAGGQTVRVVKPFRLRS